MQRRPCPLALAAARQVLGKLVDQYVDLDVEVATAMEEYALLALSDRAVQAREEAAKSAK